MFSRIAPLPNLAAQKNLHSAGAKHQFTSPGQKWHEPPWRQTAIFTMTSDAFGSAIQFLHLIVTPPIRGTAFSDDPGDNPGDDTVRHWTGDDDPGDNLGNLDFPFFSKFNVWAISF